MNLTDLVLTLHVIPELGAGKNGVTVEDTHAVQRWVGGLLGGKSTTDDVKLSQLSQKEIPRVRPTFKASSNAIIDSGKSIPATLTFF